MPQEETVDVLGYLQRLVRYVLPALVVGLLVGAGVFLTSRGGGTASYQEKAHLLVYPGAVRTDAEATQQSQLIPMMMRTYVALEDAPEFVDAVSAASKGRWTPEQVTDGLTIYWGGGSALLAFQATAPDKQEADDLANLGAETFAKTADKLVPTTDTWHPTMTVVQRSVPMSPPAAAGSPLVTAAGATVATTLLAAVVLEALLGRRRRTR